MQKPSAFLNVVVRRFARARRRLNPRPPETPPSPSHRGDAVRALPAFRNADFSPHYGDLAEGGSGLKLKGFIPIPDSTKHNGATIEKRNNEHETHSAPSGHSAYAGGRCSGRPNAGPQSSRPEKQGRRRHPRLRRGRLLHRQQSGEGQPEVPIRIRRRQILLWLRRTQGAV